VRQVLLLALVVVTLAVSLYPKGYGRAVQAYNTSNLYDYRAVASPHLEPKV
jgi:hypothetical protein